MYNWKEQKEQQREMERIKTRRDQLGDQEVQRRQVLIDHTQEICRGIIATPFQNAGNAEEVLKLAEELRERLKAWTWGE